MKTLDQLDAKLNGIGAQQGATDAKLEKRTPIASLPFTINTPGSYYVTANLTGVSGQNGITVAAENVTLDLNGFALIGVTGSGDGIAVAGSSSRNLFIRNGTVRGWLNGIRAEVASSANSQVENVRALNNSTTDSQAAGIRLGQGSIVRNCVAAGNNRGISVGTNSMILNCVAESNAGTGLSAASTGSILNSVSADNGSTGIFLGQPGVISHCTVSNNGGRGIDAGEGASISDCKITGSTDYNIYTETSSSVTRSTSTLAAGLGIGIRVGDHSTVSHCTAATNGGDGIQATSYCLIANNNASGNGTNVAGSLKDGIHLFGTGNRVDNNHAQNNGGLGIRSNGGSGADTIVRNTADGYTPASNTTMGPTNQIPSTATSPWANF